MPPALHNLHQYVPALRIMPAPALPLPPNYILLYYQCPCGAHRTNFTIHRSVLLHQIGRHDYHYYGHHYNPHDQIERMEPLIPGRVIDPAVEARILQRDREEDELSDMYDEEDEQVAEQVAQPVEEQVDDEIDR